MIAPFVFFGEGRRPEFIRAGVLADIAFLAGLHVDAIEADPIGGVGKAGVQISGVFLGLADALGVWQAALLGFDDGQLVAAIGEHIVGNVRLGAFASPLEAAAGDDFASHTAVCDDAPACVFEGGVDQLGAGFGFVHATASCKTLTDCEVSSPLKALWRRDCLRSARVVSLCW